MLQVDETVPALDPEGACQRALDAGLFVHRAHPLNAETSIASPIGEVVTPNARFYVRNHFQIPDLDPSTWRLVVGGLVRRSLSLSLRDLHAMRSQTLMVTLECAGNGRSLITPAVEGEPWGLGAVSTAEWTGIPLMEVLDRAGLKAEGREVIFRGADGGMVEGRTDLVRFERSVRLDDLRDSEVLLAYTMNGQALPIQHGYPLRVIVPGWYGVASVKWLTEIEVIDGAFSGYFQGEKYFFEWQRDGRLVREPVTLQRVRALITEPRADHEVDRGELTIRGVAWSGAAPIARVEVSVGGGPWQEARLVGPRYRYGWRWWELMATVDRPGSVTLRVRAADRTGQTQPEQPAWNRLGYGANPIQAVSVHIR